MAGKNIFNTVQGSNPSSNYFDLSHDLKFSCNMGNLIPTLCMDIVPGDKVNIGSESMLRFAALIAPIMHRVKVTQHYFFVPNRIIWDNWEDWITGNIDVEPPYLFVPQDQSENEYVVAAGSIANYMGIPVKRQQNLSSNPKINALPFAAVAKIYFDYYRDQNNCTPAFVENIEAWSILSDGDNSENGNSAMNEFFMDYGKLYRAWEHDYFTSALPFAQKGEDVMLPLGDFNDVDVFYQTPPAPLTGAGLFRNTGGAPIAGADRNFLSQSSSASGFAGVGDAAYDPNGTLKAETSALEAGAASITNLRRAFKLQEWLEKNARGGTRYVESMLVHFGVRSSDARLQRPEYLGGSVQNMVISEVLSTAQTLDSDGAVNNPVGQMAGHGISVGGSRRINYYAEEHGWIIGLLSIMPQTAYQQGIAKKFSRPDRFDYLWPSFAHIGEQAIWNQEVYWDLNRTRGENEDTFGYIPRYAEYRFENSRVAGQFTSNLDFWHLGRIFSDDNPPPALNQDFIYPNSSDFDRIFAVNSQVADTVYAHVLNKVKARRKLPKYGTPFL